MKVIRFSYFAAILLAGHSGSALAGQSVIAGSELNAPPAFWENSFYPLSTSIDRAFPFTVLSGGPYSVEQLQIVAFHYPGLASSSATFSIHMDFQGLPGETLADFQVHEISTVPEVHASAPTESLTLTSSTMYWIVGQTAQGQVNWNLGDSVFGDTAFKRPNTAWTLQENRNVSAYVILGTPIPEPTCLILIGCCVIGWLSIGRRGRKVTDTIRRKSITRHPK